MGGPADSAGTWWGPTLTEAQNCCSSPGHCFGKGCYPNSVFLIKGQSDFQVTHLGNLKADFQCELSLSSLKRQGRFLIFAKAVIFSSVPFLWLRASQTQYGAQMPAHFLAFASPCFKPHQLLQAGSPACYFWCIWNNLERIYVETMPAIN